MTCTWLLTNNTSNIVTAPVIPVPGSKTKHILVDQVGHAVLCVPVIGLIMHPVEETNLTAGVSPCPVTVVALTMVRVMDLGTDPVLLVKLDSWDQILRLIMLYKLLLDKLVHFSVMDLNCPPVTRTFFQMALYSFKSSRTFRKVQESSKKLKSRVNGPKKK